jgi:two-component system probable response regulator PhcQ
VARKVLFVDDEPRLTEALKRALRKEPYEIRTAGCADEALDILARESVDVVVSDENMPKMSGSELLSIVRTRYPDTIRIVLTGNARLDVAIRAINEGEIYRFFTKPCNEVDLAVTIRQALQQKELMEHTKRLLKMVKHQSSLLQELERSHPGISEVRTTSGGAVIVDMPETDVETLIRLAEEQIQGYEDTLGKP